MIFALPSIKNLEGITEENVRQWIQKHKDDIKKGKYDEGDCPMYKLNSNASIEEIETMKKFEEQHKRSRGLSFIVNPEIYDRLKEKDSGDEA